MSQLDRATSISQMKQGDHYCGLYRSDEEQRAITVDFIRDGIGRNEKMVYIVNIQTAATLRALLASSGIDVDQLAAKRQLVILTAKEAYLKDGEFDPDKMIAMLRSETEKALAEGYEGLRVTGEMTWALTGEPGSERLVEYESKLNEFFPNSRCYAICQYDERRFDGEALLEVLHTHPRVLSGLKAYDNENMYFVPPKAFLGPDRPRAFLDRWLHNLHSRA